MSETEPVVVVDSDGLTFKARLAPAASHEGSSQTLLQLEDGAQLLVPEGLLVPRGNGHYNLQLSLREYAEQASLKQEDDKQQPDEQQADESVVLPVAEETVRVDKRTRERGVQVAKRVHEHQETVDVPLLQERVEVERVTVNRRVDEPVPVRYEGDTTIIPLFEEVLVVKKQLMLVEEVRITKHRSEHHEPQQVTLRREEVRIIRGEGEEEDA